MTRGFQICTFVTEEPAEDMPSNDGYDYDADDEFLDDEDTDELAHLDYVRWSEDNEED